MAAELPEHMKHLACLKAGANEVRVDYERLKDVGSPGLTIELKSGEKFGTDECLFRLREDPDDGDGPGCVTKSFDM
jgi:hypothetical protein